MEAGLSFVFWQGWGDGWEEESAAPVAVLAETPLVGSKRRVVVRGPYNDPRIFEEYIKRCIAEREAPRTTSLPVAVLKESLVDVVEERRGAGLLDWGTLIREQEILARLAAVEQAKRDIRAIEARMIQIAKQLKKLEAAEQERLEAEEVSMLLAVFEYIDGD